MTIVDQALAPRLWPRRILLVVTGMSPQVVTETVYALAVARVDEPYVPTEVHIITTLSGAREARLNLLADDTGWFHRLREDYQLPEIKLDDSTIHVITDTDGNKLDDIRTPKDNEHAADSITELVRQLTEADDSSLHVSIAGGRKTMGYYLGYALSLYGRMQDRLSHVLVSAPFENNRQFFYPTPYEKPIFIRQGEKEQTFDAREAVVDLAQIPFVRLRDGIDEALKSGKASFSEVVSQAQRVLPPVFVSVDLAQKKVLMGDIEVKFTDTQLALYLLLLMMKKNGQPGFHWSMDNAESLFLDCVGKISGSIHTGRYEEKETALKRGMTASYINPIKTNINKKIRMALGKRMARDYEIVNVKVPGSSYELYCLPMRPEQIYLPEEF